jgi:hypothetical protein
LSFQGLFSHLFSFRAAKVAKKIQVHKNPNHIAAIKKNLILKLLFCQNPWISMKNFVSLQCLLDDKAEWAYHLMDSGQ